MLAERFHFKSVWELLPHHSSMESFAVYRGSQFLHYQTTQLFPSVRKQTRTGPIYFVSRRVVAVTWTHSGSLSFKLQISLLRRLVSFPRSWDLTSLDTLEIRPSRFLYISASCLAFHNSAPASNRSVRIPPPCQVNGNGPRMRAWDVGLGNSDVMVLVSRKLMTKAIDIIPARTSEARSQSAQVSIYLMSFSFKLFTKHSMISTLLKGFFFFWFSGLCSMCSSGWIRTATWDFSNLTTSHFHIKVVRTVPKPRWSAISLRMHLGSTC